MDEGRDIPALAVRFEATGLVEYAEPDWLLPLCRTPDDPLVEQQWALSRVEAFAAWDQLPLEPDFPQAIIAVVDAGMTWTHEDLLQQLWINPGEDLDGDGAQSPDEIPGDPDDRNGLDDDGNGFVDDFFGWDFVHTTNGAPGEDVLNQDNNPVSLSPHGTQVAGLAGARADNGRGIASLAWNARLMPLRAGYLADDGNSYIISTAAAQAIYYATLQGARLINLSFSGSGTVRTPATAAWNSGVLCLHAASDMQDQLDLATGIVSVTATSAQDCAFYCGDWIDLAAPGFDLLTTTNSGYEPISGSSFATAMATSLAALLLAMDPTLDNVGLRGRLLATADPIDDLTCNAGCATGAGRINARRALQNDTGLDRVSVQRQGGSRLDHLWPNPFNPMARVSFHLERAGQVRLLVHDLLGREVARPLAGLLAPGWHELPFDGGALAAGLYLLRLEVDGQPVDQRKAVLLK
ncbi:MAG: S8 family serine peptidase [bacterium]|nr:S8 family serine peptidase [bacterium]